MAGRPPSDDLAGYVEAKQRRDGRVEYVYTQPYKLWVTTPDGPRKVKRKLQSKPFDPTNPKAKERAIREAITRVAEKQANPPEPHAPKPREEKEQRPTVRSASEEYLAGIVRYDSRNRASGPKASTVKEFRKNLSRAESTEPPIADRAWADLTSTQIRTHLANFAKCHAATTYDRYRAHLYTLGNHAVQNRYWAENLVPKSRAKDRHAASPTASGENQALALEEVLALNRAAAKHSPQMFAALRLLRLGLRIGEVLALSEDDIDFDKNRIHVRYSQGVEHPDWAEGRRSPAYLDSTKTRASTADVAVSNEVLAAVRASLAKAKPSAIPAFDDLGTTRTRRFVVNNLQGRAWRYNNFLRMIRQVFTAAGVDLREKRGVGVHGSDRYNHIWRNTYAADLVALGADDIRLQTLMRHRDANTSKSVYASARKSQIKAFERYRSRIDKIEDYNWTITKIDTDMESGRSPFLERQFTLRDVDLAD